MEHHFDTGKYGAKRGSYSERNPRALLKRLIDENPNAKIDLDFAIELLFSELFPEDILPEINDLEFFPELQEMIKYWAVNTWNSLTREYRPRIVAKEPSVAKAKFEQLKKAAEIMDKFLPDGLNTIMVNGKKLSDCTGNECIEIGGLISNIGYQASDKLIGEIFTTKEQLQEFISNIC